MLMAPLSSGFKWNSQEIWAQLEFHPMKANCYFLPGCLIFFFFIPEVLQLQMDISQGQLSLSFPSMLLYASNSVISPSMHFLSENICYFKIFFFSLLRYPETPIIFQLEDFFFLSSLSVTLFLISSNYVSFCKFLHFFFVSDFIFSGIYSLTWCV